MSTTSPAPASQEHVRVSPYPERRRSPVSSEVYQLVASHVYRLVVQPIVKATVGERDSPGNNLDPFVAGGTSFQEILQKLWEQFSPQVKGRAVKTDGTWTIEPATRTKLMIYKEHLNSINQSTHMALDCVNASIAEAVRLRNDWDAYGRRLECFEISLPTRKAQIESFLHHIDLPNQDELADPLENMENVEDIEHQ
ncbi:uncharacterized protein PITG_15983 [Phytophthora infestans T30-4]|uniref:Uncharacterized protein n=1 Tax=Phytophthora infestans (strain T30-4) TaxID=403677 RepID=D0NSK9_PHYIT|nr:uncharacterized protein PITG_15983 [Phytophthora infestans T30-4]EEY64571.1 conserved hypothetical protein [Phytophthora infestans T30-4]|eukprot:XP_002897771.1 conserved hypothetical protein [Phytophthora infestans T30-4]